MLSYTTTVIIYFFPVFLLVQDLPADFKNK
jgi:hypothetical protein